MAASISRHCWKVELSIQMGELLRVSMGATAEESEGVFPEIQLFFAKSGLR